METNNDSVKNGNMHVLNCVLNLRMTTRVASADMVQPELEDEFRRHHAAVTQLVRQIRTGSIYQLQIPATR